MAYVIVAINFGYTKEGGFVSLKNKNDARKRALDILLNEKDIHEVKVWDTNLPRFFGPVYQIRKPVLGGKRYKVIVSMR